jgi:chemotaxis protein histidine kinase CheA
VLAAEAAYVGLLGTHPKFQKYVDAQEAKEARDQGSLSAERTLKHITRALPRESLDRFEALRTRCRELREIAVELKHPGKEKADWPLEDFQLAGLDRLLWIYLRLLYTHFSLERFLERTPEKRIQQDIQHLESRIAKLPKETDSPRSQRVRRTLEDNLQTSRSRLENWTKARENQELVELEIDRLENKIRSLSELAVNRQEPEFISQQVDHVASSMLETERTMNELQFATGLEDVDEQAPELLGTKAAELQS